MSSTERITGNVFDLQRFSLHDGPGIRTTVFLKGCNLRCAWCHNPESFLKRPQIRVDLKKCILCGNCTLACPNKVHRMEADGPHTIHPEACTVCGACVDACPISAISIVGKEYAPHEVIELVLKDKKYYETSGGGVTFSGGEPTFQYEFLMQILKLSKAEGLHVCLETNGLVPEESLQELSRYVDLFLFDYKHSDEEQHRKYTGASNRQILNSLHLLNRLNRPVILRCPIIPGINDTPGHFESIRLLKHKYNNIQEVELMPYHRIGISKWDNLGYSYSLKDIEAPEKAQISAWKQNAGLK